MLERPLRAGLAVPGVPKFPGTASNAAAEFSRRTMPANLEIYFLYFQVTPGE